MDYGNLRIPEWMKLIMLFIDRIGFPILAFILMSYMFYLSQTKLSTAIEDNTKALLKFSTSTAAFQDAVSKDHVELQAAVEKNGDRITQLYMYERNIKMP